MMWLEMSGGKKKEKAEDRGGSQEDVGHRSYLAGGAAALVPSRLQRFQQERRPPLCIFAPDASTVF